MICGKCEKVHNSLYEFLKHGNKSCKNTFDMDLKTGEHTSKKVRLLSEYIMALSITKSTAAQSEMFEHQNATNIDCLSAMCQKYIMSKFANGLTFPLH